MILRTYETSTERLRAVADIIESDPEHWNQETWTSVPGSVPRRMAETYAGQDSRECGTTSCIAGWGAIVTPASAAPFNRFFTWEGTGRAAFGLSAELADQLFYTVPAEHVLNDVADPAPMANALRELSYLPEECRTWENEDVQQILADLRWAYTVDDE